MSTGAEAQPGTWLAVGVLVGLALALLIGVLLGGAAWAHRSRRAVGRAGRSVPPAPAGTPAGPPPPAAPAFEVDDLPGFFDRPPGSVPGPAASPAEAGPTERATAALPGTSGTAAVTDVAAAGQPPARGPAAAGIAGIAGAIVLLVAAVALAFAGGVGVAPVGVAGSRVPAAGPAPSTAPDSSATPTADAPPAAPGTSAGGLTMTSVPLGAHGLAARATFHGLVLEQRAVGLTVTYPSVSVTTDGRRSLAHLRLPTFNCLTVEPPADPTAAGCIRTLTEYAELAGPELQLSRDGGRIDLAGRFPTYTRPNGVAPTFTGRVYQLTATMTAAPEDPARGAGAPVPLTGVVRIGLGSAPTTADRGVNVLHLPG